MPGYRDWPFLRLADESWPHHRGLWRAGPRDGHGDAVPRPRCHLSRVNITDAAVLGEAAVWATETGVDGACNITNGDIFRWSHVWPVLADWFGLPMGEPKPISLDQRLKPMAPVRSALAAREGLVEGDVSRLAQGGFGDFSFPVKTGPSST